MEKQEKTTENQACLGSTAAPGYVLVCPHCKQEIPGNMVQQGGLHMSCFNTEIDVFFISLPDSPTHGFYEIDPSQVMEQFKSAEEDEPYLIQKKVMVAGQYHNLPEFQGF